MLLKFFFCKLNNLTLSPCAVDSHPTPGDIRGSSSPSRSISGVSSHVADCGSARVPMSVSSHLCLGAKTIKKNTNSTQNKCETHRAKQYEVTSFLSTDCDLSTETCSKNVYSIGPLSSSPRSIHSPEHHVIFHPSCSHHVPKVA